MAITNRDRVGTAMDLLHVGLLPYVKREMKVVYRDGWLAEAGNVTNRLYRDEDDAHFDSAALLALVCYRWEEVFKQKLSPAERSIAFELRDARNRWAHQEQFSSDDTYRTLDSIERLLTAVSAPEAAEVGRQKMDILRLRFDEQACNVRRRAAVTPVEGQPAGNLKPWREIITPHKDVAAGSFQQAEFAADLGQVHRGEGSSEYSDPREFFSRTYLTEGLRHLLTNALERLDGTGGGDPVVKLQTNFGGGKTHSMLALYHLFSGASANTLPGIEPILQATGVTQPSTANRAVLVGTALAPGAARRKPDGTVVNTMWGELAWQLLGARGYELVADADRTGTSPGSDTLRDLFRESEPSLILIDEWVAFVRQLYNVDGLPAGSFDANLTFAQALTEAARAVPGTLIIASLPSSDTDIEVGGSAGHEALARLANTVGRLESVWKPASSEEGFEIVRRRLFEGIPAELQPQRDAVVRGFIDLYRSNAQEFPHGCGEGEYERRMQAAYPIHPEVFDRLFEDWSQLERFQRTRGVLRLMASVIHTLWERDDRSLLIMPSSVPMDSPAVQYELTRYLEDNWQPVIERDVDGPNALPIEIDRTNAGTLGRYSATRRAARTVYLGSAPITTAANRGIDSRHIRLGCVQPGESIATFGDALGRLTNQATYLYSDGGRYWYSTTPTVNRLAQDRAAQQHRDDVLEEIRIRLRKEAAARGAFSRVHAFPTNSSDVPDEDEVRLVMLGPEYSHSGRATDSPARASAAEILDNRGTSPRLYRNMLVFLAPDARQLEALESGVREFLAWQSINNDRETLNLDNFQSNQAKTKLSQTDDAVKQRIPETYQWLLVPTQPDPNAGIEWVETKVSGQGSLADRAARKLQHDGTLITESYGYALLKYELARIPLWRPDDVSVRQLWDDYAKYLYLPRLKDSSVLLQAIRTGVGRMLWRNESFAYAQRKDENGRYHGLVHGQDTSVTMDGSSLVVKPDIAQLQIDIDNEIGDPLPGTGGTGGIEPGKTGGGTTDTTTGGGTVVDPEPRPVVHRRFHASTELDSLRVSSSAGVVFQEVIQHLTGLVGANVRITLEIEADLPQGAPDHVVRTVTENARTLKFTDYGFEEH